MSFIEVSEIEFTARKTCFIAIPLKWTIKTSDKMAVFRIKPLTEHTDGVADDEVVMSWSGDTTTTNTIQVNGLFANKLGFSHKQQVLVTLVPNPDSYGIANATKCYLKPISDNDWQILAMNSAFIETNLLNQIRVLSFGQIFPVWITNQSNVCLFVEAFHLTPKKSKAIVLNQLTEVIVCPPNTSRETIDREVNDNSLPQLDGQPSNTQSVATNDTNASQSMVSSVFGFVKSFITNPSPEESKPNSNENSKSLDKIQIESNLNFNHVLRVLPFLDDKQNEDKDLVNTIFVSKDVFNNICETNFFISKLTHILSPNERKLENQKNDKSIETNSTSNDALNVSKKISELEFKETLVEVCGHNGCPNTSVFICDSLRRQLGLSITSRVLLSQLNESSYPVITSLTLCPINVSPKKSKVSTDLIRSDLNRLIDKTSAKMLSLTNGSLIHLCETDFFTYHKSETSLYVITKQSVQQLIIDISEPVMAFQKGFCENALPLRRVQDIDVKLKSTHNIQYKNKPFAGFDDVFKKCLNTLKFALKCDDLSQYFQDMSTVKMSSLLICGQKGSGKSHLVSALIDKLSNEPHFVFIHYIDCHSLKGKRIETIQKIWNQCVAECLHRQPSLLVFEDLDAIASMPSKPGQESSAEALHSERIGILFMDLIENINRNEISYGNRVAVISTSKSNKTLQTLLVQSRGKHLFQESIELSSPDLKQRMDIISNLIAHKYGVDYNDLQINVNLKDTAIRCKGYQPLDICALIERAFHNCCLISQTNCVKDLVLNDDNFLAAFDGFSPASLRGLDLELKSSRRLCEVGGLTDVKKCLMETILWSIRYPVLFSKLPLKAQSSILLFGAPGTGKTLLIEAIANECGINFIGIKGPELLSKYVGASEQSVRDLFSRAESAKPCILFFDEFDALAPRRGHDSTGVTDRVVNQLLTQMDGFEELGTGVYVLSATSRPDLIDPALLRPGRFDKCLHCPLPNQQERLEILNILNTKLSLSADVDLEMISHQTNHYTGADLQALLYSAQLDALHYGLNDEHNNKQIKSSDSLHNQSLDSIASYMPSVSKGFSRDLDSNERQKLINEIDIYLPNTVIDGNNSVDITSTRHSSVSNLIAIQQKHILAALDITKPSITESERKKYDKIYEAFVSSGGQSFSSLSTMDPKRVTLA